MPTTAEQLSANLNLAAVGKVTTIRKRFWITVGLLLAWRLGTHLQLPGTNQAAMLQVLQQTPSTFLAVFDIYAGGALGRLSIFALSVAPYILAGNLVSAFTSASKKEAILRERGETTDKTNLRQFDRRVFWLTALLAALLGYWLAVSLETIIPVASIVTSPGLFFRLTSSSLLIVGALLLMWIDKRIRRHGMQCDVSLITICGIIAQLPAALITVLKVRWSLGFDILFMTGSAVGLLFIVSLVVLIERAQRRVLIQYPRQQAGNRLYKGVTSMLPLKLSYGGLITLNSATLMVWLMFGLLYLIGEYGPSWAFAGASYHGYDSSVPFVVFTGLIMFFSFFTTAGAINPQETAEQLRKSGGFIPGIRPGSMTAQFLDYVMTRICVVGALYLVVVGVGPDLILYKYAGTSLFFTGMAILIVVTGALDIVARLQAELLTAQCEGLIKKVKLRGTRRAAPPAGVVAREVWPFPQEVGRRETGHEEPKMLDQVAHAGGTHGLGAKDDERPTGPQAELPVKGTVDLAELIGSATKLAPYI